MRTGSVKDFFGRNLDEEKVIRILSIFLEKEKKEANLHEWLSLTSNALLMNQFILILF